MDGRSPWMVGVHGWWEELHGHWKGRHAALSVPMRTATYVRVCGSR